MTRYAKDTEVSQERSIAEIERIVESYGATAFSYARRRDPGLAVVEFEMCDRRIRFVQPMPDPSDKEFTHTVARGTKRTPEAAREEWQKACRQRWRALALLIKAKLEASENNIEVFEHEFATRFVMTDGRTIMAELKPRITEAIVSTSHLPALMAGNE